LEMDASVIDAGGGNAGPSLGFESISITDSAPLSTASGTLSSNQTTVNIALTCGGNGAPFISGYTATSTTLVLIVNPEMLTYTKQ
jgi:hypothetical protein